MEPRVSTGHAGRERLIFPLDVPDLAEAERWIKRLSPWVGTFKLGLELFSAAGPAAVEKLADLSGSRVFLDLKFHDIPATVEGAARAVSRLGGVRFLTVIADGGDAMLRAAIRGAGDAIRILGVTRLTSRPADPASVVAVARDAVESGCRGLVCSGAEVADVRQAVGPDVELVCPGVRPAGVDRGDQVRVAGVTEAVAAGADFLVVGRPIREDSDPERRAEAICEEIRAALELRANSGEAGG